MYGIYWNIYQDLPEQNQTNVSKYSIHGAYGVGKYTQYFWKRIKHVTRIEICLEKNKECD